MSGDMIALHNTEAEGYHPHDVGSAEVEEETECFGVWTRRNYRPETVEGKRVWVIRAVGSPRTYYLCYTFIVDGIGKDSDPYFVYGSDGEAFDDPEISLNHRSGWFRDLYEPQNNFSLGLAKIDGHFAREFEALRAKYREQHRE